MINLSIPEILSKSREASAMVDNFKRHFTRAFSFSPEVLSASLEALLGPMPFDLQKGLSYLFALDCHANNREHEKYFVLFYHLILNYDDIYRTLDSLIQNADEAYNPLLTELPLHPLSNLLLKRKQIKYLSDFQEYSVESAILLLAFNLKEFLASARFLGRDLRIELQLLLNPFFAKLSPRDSQIIDLRLGLTDKKQPLEMIGQLFNITRERIRKVELRFFHKLTYISPLVEILLFQLVTQISQNEQFVPLSQFITQVGDRKIALILLEIIKTSRLALRYYEPLNLIYNAEQVSLPLLLSRLEQKFGYYISANTYSHLTDLERQFVDINYSLLYGPQGVYFKNGIKLGDIILPVIDTVFPQGFPIDDESSFRKLKAACLARYGVADFVSTIRNVAGIVLRSDFCVIDKGLYKRRAFCVELNPDLIAKIINYILVQRDIVFYASIYKHFRAPLEALGVDNYYYLKSLIDPHLPASVKARRHHILLDRKAEKGSTLLINNIREFNGIFSLKELKHLFPGVANCVFYNLLYQEQSAGLIFLAKKRFVYIHKSAIEPTLISKLQAHIEDLMDELNSDLVTARKLYARIYFLDRPLLESLPAVEDDFSLFSLTKHLLDESYQFSRPFISKGEQITFYQAILRFIEGQEQVTLAQIKAYCAKLNISFTTSFPTIVESLAEQYVQINVDTIVSKEKLNLSFLQQKKICDMLTLLLEQFKKINLRNYFAYDNLPLLHYPWNKYLLAGITRSYFNDQFEVIRTKENTNDEFVIRRISHEQMAVSL